VNIAEAEADPNAWPGFADAQYQQCWLEEGDMLYIPHRWWHAMQSEHPTAMKHGRNEPTGANCAYNISVNFWFAQPVYDPSNAMSL
jgi:ribosomal protein L16 Arg81 hydroxylase